MHLIKRDGYIKPQKLNVPFVSSFFPLTALQSLHVASDEILTGKFVSTSSFIMASLTIRTPKLG